MLYLKFDPLLVHSVVCIFARDCHFVCTQWNFRSQSITLYDGLASETFFAWFEDKVVQVLDRLPGDWDPSKWTIAQAEIYIQQTDQNSCAFIALETLDQLLAGIDKPKCTTLQLKASARAILSLCNEALE